MTKITNQNWPLLEVRHEDGTPVAGVTDSESEIYALEKVLDLPPGTYLIERPDAVVVTEDCVAPAPEPEPSPTPDPDPTPEPEPELEYSWSEIADTAMSAVFTPVFDIDEMRYLGGKGSIVGAWNGVSYDSLRNSLDSICCGGHADWAGNQHLRYLIDEERWELIREPSLPGPDYETHSTTGRTPDGLPAARHTYGGLLYIPTIDRHLLIGGSLTGGAGKADNRRWLIDPVDGSAELIGPDVTAHAFLGHQCTYDVINDKVYFAYAGTFKNIDLVTGDLTTLTSPAEGSAPSYKFGIAMDYTRGNILVIGGDKFRTFNVNTNTLTKYSSNPDQTTYPINDPLIAPMKSKKAPGLVYHPDMDKFIGWAGGNTIYLIDPVDFSVELVDSTGIPAYHSNSGVYGRFALSTNGNIYVVDGIDNNVKMVKLPLL